MAGMGYKAFTRERLASADVQGYLMDQSVMVFASASARAARLTAPTFGMVTYLTDVERYECYVPASGGGGAWVDAFGDSTPPIDVAYAANFAAQSDPALGWSGLKYWKRSGVVALHGALRTTAATSSLAVVAVLPVGFRPPTTVQLAPNSQVTAAGEIRLTSAQALNAAVSLGGSWPLGPA